MDASVISTEILGGLAALLAAIYGVHKKLRSDSVESTIQKAEINIIESLIKQRDDAIELSDKYRDRYMLTENEIRILKSKLDSFEHENLKLLEQIDEKDTEAEVLRSIIKYLTDAVSVTRKRIEIAEELEK